MIDDVQGVKILAFGNELSAFIFLHTWWSCNAVTRLPEQPLSILVLSLCFFCKIKEASQHAVAKLLIFILLLQVVRQCHESVGPKNYGKILELFHLGYWDLLTVKIYLVITFFLTGK